MLHLSPDPVSSHLFQWIEGQLLQNPNVFPQLAPLRPIRDMSNCTCKLEHALVCTLSQGLSKEEGNFSLFHFHVLETRVFQLIRSLRQPGRLASSNRRNILWKSGGFRPTSLPWLRGLTEVDFISITVTR